jgi:hypothetical protein
VSEELPARDYLRTLPRVPQARAARSAPAPRSHAPHAAGRCRDDAEVARCLVEDALAIRSSRARATRPGTPDRAREALGIPRTSC